jgi:7-keto-8-aminopelargonate synthetase-like enzyme
VTAREPAGVRVTVDGRVCVAFCSNDYLGLAADPRLAEVAADAARRYGVGSGASPPSLAIRSRTMGAKGASAGASARSFV